MALCKPIRAPRARPPRRLPFTSASEAALVTTRLVIAVSTEHADGMCDVLLTTGASKSEVRKKGHNNVLIHLIEGNIRLTVLQRAVISAANAHSSKSQQFPHLMLRNKKQSCVKR